MKVEVWTLISMYDIVDCKELQEYVKSIVKDYKNVLKPETVLQKTPGF